MNDNQPQPNKRNLIPANFNDDDAAMSRKIFFGFLAIAGLLLALLAIPGIKSLLEKVQG